MIEPFARDRLCISVQKIYTQRQVGIISEIQKAVESLDSASRRGYTSPKCRALLRSLNALKQEYRESYGERVPDEKGRKEILSHAYND